MNTDGDQVLELIAIIEDLSPRHRDVLRLILEGYSFKEISNKLSLSEKTVKNHSVMIREKFDVKSITKLMALLMVKRYANT